MQRRKSQLRPASDKEKPGKSKVEPAKAFSVAPTNSLNTSLKLAP